MLSSAITLLSISQIEATLLEISIIPSVYLPGILILGLLIGSFLNVVIFRLPKMMEQEFREECHAFLAVEEKPESTPKMSLSTPNSTCPACKQPIKPWHNIPVISYLFLKGRCASCNTTISIRYPIIELVTGLLSLLTVILLGFTLPALVSLVLLWTLIALTMIDIDTQLLPDSMTLPLLWLGLIANSIGLYTELSTALWGAIFGYVSLWSVFWVFKIITKKEGMGYGDFKLLAALGAWMGWQAIPMIILLSSFVGAIVGIIGIAILGRDKNIPIPFGPYLATAGWITFMWGDSIADTYFKLFL